MLFDQLQHSLSKPTIFMKLLNWSWSHWAKWVQIGGNFLIMNRIKMTYHFPIYIQARERNRPTESRCWGTMELDTSKRSQLTSASDHGTLVNGSPVPPTTEPADQNVASSTLTHESHPAAAFTSCQLWAHLIISADVLRLHAVCV